MKLKIAILLCASALTTGCVNTELSTAGKSYNPQEDARIRLYGQNGRPMTLVIDPFGKAEKVVVGGGMGQAFASMLHMKGNESIGMAPSKVSQTPEIFNNIGSGTFYKEFVIPTNVEVAVKNNINTPAHVFKDAYTGKTTISYGKCGSNNLSDAIIFKPIAGKDYEVIPSLSTQECGVQVIELN